MSDTPSRCIRTGHMNDTANSIIVIQTQIHRADTISLELFSIEFAERSSRHTLKICRDGLIPPTLFGTQHDGGVDDHQI